MKHNAKWAEETVKIKVEYGEFSEAEVILRCKPGGHSARCSAPGDRRAQSKAGTIPKRKIRGKDGLC